MRRLLRCRSGSSAAEFALVLPLLILLLFGVIDGGRWLYNYNQAEKATQMGARYAIVADLVPAGVGSSYLGVGGLTQGDVIPAAAFGKISCTSGGCSCATSPCPAIGAVSSADFNAIVARMQQFFPEITAANVAVDYSSSGLGYAGNPNGPDLAPLVTVRLINMQFRPMMLFGGVNVGMPDFASSLTLEDARGAQSN